MMHKRRGLSLNTKLTATYTIIIVLVAGALALTLYWELRQAQRQAIRGHLLDVVNFASAQIDGDFHSLIVSPEDATSSYYHIIHGELQKIQSMSNAIQRLYTLRQLNDGSIVMVADSATLSDTQTTIGQKAERMTPLLEAGLTTVHQPVVEEEIVIDPSGGVLFYGYGPIVDQSGRQDGVLAIEFDASAVIESETHARNTALSAFLVILPLVLLVGFWLGRRFIAPIKELSRGAESIAQGQLDQRVPVHTNDELGVLAETFNTMADSLQSRIVAEHQALQALQLSHEKLQAYSHSLEQSMREQQRLSDTVREMSLPIIPIAERIIVMPLVGVIDGTRARELAETLLHGIETHRARIALIDLTGVPLVDTHVAQTLIGAINAVRLLGARTLLVGIRPELAAAFIQVDTDLNDIETSATLQSGLLRAMQLMGWQVTEGSARRSSTQ